MKIGFFTDTYTPQINGVVTSIESYRKELEKRGHLVFVFAPTPKQKKDSKKIIRFPSVKFIFQPEMRIALPYSLEALRLLEKIKLDIIHSQDPFSIGLFGLWMAKKFKIPYVHTYHTLYPEYVHYIWETRLTKKIAKRLSKDFCNQCDLVVAPSTKIKKYLKLWGVKKPLEILPTGIELDEFKIDLGAVANFREKYKILTQEKILIFVGRLGKEKNIELLIKSLKLIKTPGVKLLIIGDGPHKPKLQSLIKKEGFENKVSLTGYLPRKEVVAALRASKIFVFSSKTETQGLVVAEAMAAGLPVVAVSDLAIADMVKDKKNGFLVKSSAREMAKKIDKLLTNQKLYGRMSRASKNLAKNFSAEKQTKKLEKIYQGLLKK